LCRLHPIVPWCCALIVHVSLPSPYWGRRVILALTVHNSTIQWSGAYTVSISIIFHWGKTANFKISQLFTTFVEGLIYFNSNVGCKSWTILLSLLREFEEKAWIVMIMIRAGNFWHDPQTWHEVKRLGLRLKGFGS